MSFVLCVDLWKWKRKRKKETNGAIGRVMEIEVRIWKLDLSVEKPGLGRVGISVVRYVGLR